jgi:hypothetical protein
MKKILIVSFVVLVALMGTIGTASAYGLNFVNDNGDYLTASDKTLQVGVPATFSFELQDNSNGVFKDKYIYYEIVDDETSDGITIEFLKDQPHFIPSFNGNVYVDEDAVQVTIEHGAVQGQVFDAAIKVYTVENGIIAVVTNEEGGELIGKFRATATEDFNAQIPEFPTIALPIAAILGLAFLIQRRKEE